MASSEGGFENEAIVYFGKINQMHLLVIKVKAIEARTSL